MHACLWDVRSHKKPVTVFPVHDHLRDRLMDVYDNEAIFDRLGCSISPNGQNVVAGTYGEVAVFSAASPESSTLRTCVSPTAINVCSRAIPQRLRCDDVPCMHAAHSQRSVR